MVDGRRASDHGGPLAVDYATREDLRETGRDIVAQMNQRFDEQRELGNARHSENIDRMAIITEQHAETAHRVTILEQIFKALSNEFDNSRRRLKELRDDVDKLVLALRNDMNAAIASIKTRATGRDAPGDSRAVTQRELMLLVGLIVGCVTATGGIIMWVLHMVGKL